jgi:hypothetical protein
MVVSIAIESAPKKSVRTAAIANSDAIHCGVIPSFDARANPSQIPGCIIDYYEQDLANVTRGQRGHQSLKALGV